MSNNFHRPLGHNVFIIEAAVELLKDVLEASSGYWLFKVLLQSASIRSAYWLKHFCRIFTLRANSLYPQRTKKTRRQKLRLIIHRVEFLPSTPKIYPFLDFDLYISPIRLFCQHAHVHWIPFMVNNWFKISNFYMSLQLWINSKFDYLSAKCSNVGIKASILHNYSIWFSWQR